MYVISYFSGVLKESLVVTCSYRMIRKYAGVWHALSPFNCAR
ncbi:accessory gene regulator B family protein [Listeria farberi]